MDVGDSVDVIVLCFSFSFDQGLFSSLSLGYCIFGQRFTQQIETLSGTRTDANARDITIFVPLDSRRGIGEVDLVPYDDLPDGIGTNFCKHLVNLADLLVTSMAGAVHHMQKKIGIGRRFKSGVESIDQ